jgi:uncharacterized protein (DUF2147 family)
MMTRLFLTLTLLGAAALAPALSVPASAQQPSAAAQQPSAEGLWEQIDEKTGKAESWFRVYKKGDVYEGQIVKMFPKPGDDPNKEWRCDKCEGEDKNAPVLGMALIKGMKRNGLAYEDGTITDPRDGSVYRALMNLSPDNKTMEMRGYLGISLFGRSQTWKRLPDDAMGPATATPGRRPSQPAAAAPRRTEQAKPAQPPASQATPTIR